MRKAYTQYLARLRVQVPALGKQFESVLALSQPQWRAMSSLELMEMSMSFIYESSVIPISAHGEERGPVAGYVLLSRLCFGENVLHTECNLLTWWTCSLLANRSCTATEFTCANNRPPLRRCIPRAWVCDGDADCSDALDEHQNCTRRSCTENEFTCNNGLCIRSAYRFVTTIYLPCINFYLKMIWESFMLYSQCLALAFNFLFLYLSWADSVQLVVDTGNTIRTHWVRLYVMRLFSKSLFCWSQ